MEVRFHRVQVEPTLEHAQEFECSVFEFKAARSLGSESVQSYSFKISNASAEPPRPSKPLPKRPEARLRRAPPAHRQHRQAPQIWRNLPFKSDGSRAQKHNAGGALDWPQVSPRSAPVPTLDLSRPRPACATRPTLSQVLRWSRGRNLQRGACPEARNVPGRMRPNCATRPTCSQPPRLSRGPDHGELAARSVSVPTPKSF
ncbi:hypothetical protein B0H15DRAFT_833059 [Mycena belliarum]|uniref:Uncharacterized protein n=1 Tax=Mycena belliarum TaxID=1033014 RepID=A0AAD6UCF2_9AGAR|nr:hypothetical protein B0H15DRAFT_833059 [Mycena belliae]